MVRWPGALVILFQACVLGGCALRVWAPPPTVPAHPLRVMSLNQCTDQLLLMLLPPVRIASVTWLSRDPRFSAEAAAARRVPINHGGVEDVARTRPDLIVTDTFSNASGRALLHRLGYPMIEIADAASIADIRRNVRTLAATVDERGRGEALIAAMDRALTPPKADVGQALRVAAWDRDGMTTGPILGAVLQAVGAVDVGAPTGDVEALLAARPTLLVDREDGAGDPSLGDDRARHPIVNRLWPAPRRLHVPRASLFCATPAIARAAISLRAQVAATRAASRVAPII